MEIPVVWLAAHLGAMLCVSILAGSAFWVPGWVGASLVLLMGTGVLLAMPGRLGEADVLYLASFPVVLGFFPLLFALGLACVGGMALFSWRALVSRSWVDVPVPFTPLLFWGVFSEFMIQGVFQ